MKITREKACQRLHHRVSTPLHLHIDGRDYSASDWSLGGFLVADWDRWNGDLKIGDRLSCTFELPFQGFNIAFDVETEIVRMDRETGVFAAKFIHLDDRQIELMNHFVEQLVRGAMTPINDTILRIDSPVTPVSTEPDANPTAELPNSRLPGRLIFMSTLYATLGIVLFGLLTITLYENFLSIKVNTAVTSVPVEPIVSLTDGRIKQVNSVIDEPLLEGDPIFVIESPQLKKRITEAKIEIEQKKLELEAQRKRHVLAIETTGSAASKEVRTHQIEIDLKAQEVSLAMQNLVALYDYKEQLSIVSPDDGRMTNVFRQRGALVKRGETLGIFERRETPIIHAFLTEDEARSIKLEQLTQIHLLSLDQHWLGHVTNIRPNSIDASNQQFNYRPANLQDRHVLVEIQFNINQQIPSYVRSGLPAEVRFATSSLSQAVVRYLTRHPEPQRIIQKPNKRRVL